MASFSSFLFRPPAPKPPPSSASQLNTSYRWSDGRKIHLRRRKLPIVRLGGERKPRRRLFFSRIFRRVKLRWLKLQYSCMVKKLKKYYEGLIKDIIESSASMESIQQRILLETSMAVPVMGVSFSSYHGGGGTLNRSRSITFL